PDAGAARDPGTPAGRARSRQGPGEHRRELQSIEPLAEPASLRLAVRGQRDVGSSGVLTRDRPGGLAVPRQVGKRKRIAHDRLLVAALAWHGRTLQPSASWTTLPSVSRASIKTDLL